MGLTEPAPRKRRIARPCVLRGVRVAAQVFDEHDEEVQDALAAEAARGPQADRATELQPLHHKQGAKHGDAPRDADDDGDDDDDDEVRGPGGARACRRGGRPARAATRWQGGHRAVCRFASAGRSC